MSVIGPMKKFDLLPIMFQSVPIETESEKIGTRLIGIGIGVTQYLAPSLTNEEKYFCKWILYFSPY